jgi:hypothetical protein
MDSIYISEVWSSSNRAVPVHLRITCLSHRGGQIKDLFHWYFACLLSIIEPDIVKYKSFHDNVYAIFCYMFLLSVRFIVF